MTKQFIYTNFSKAKRHLGPHYSIALISPPNLRGFRELPLFYPTEHMLGQSKAGKMPREEYKALFYELLEARRMKIWSLVPHLSDGSVLCCWCSLGPTKDGSESFCHRLFVADYLSRFFGIASIIE